jgi:hypothetical protein
MINFVTLLQGWQPLWRYQSFFKQRDQKRKEIKEEYRKSKILFLLFSLYYLSQTLFYRYIAIPKLTGNESYSQYSETTAFTRFHAWPHHGIACA